MRTLPRLRLTAGVAASLLFVAASPQSSVAQGIPISEHFGGLTTPDLENVWEAGFTFDRFTNLTKPSDTLNARQTGAYDTKNRQYALRTAIGLNAGHISYARRLPMISSIIRVGAFAGWLNDKPTETLQNEFRHNDIGLDYVPTDSIARGTLYGIFGSLDRWVDLLPKERHINLAVHGGLDANASNFYSDAAVRLGVRTTYINLFGWQEVPQFAIDYRKAFWVMPGEILRHAPRHADSRSVDDLLANTYEVKAASVTLPLSTWIRNRSLIPDVRWTVSTHTGLFLAEPHGTTSFKRMSEGFDSYALLWGGGDVALETYNDARGGKDIGPTFGARLYGRWHYWGSDR